MIICCTELYQCLRWRFEVSQFYIISKSDDSIASHTLLFMISYDFIVLGNYYTRILSVTSRIRNTFIYERLIDMSILQIAMSYEWLALFSYCWFTEKGNEKSAHCTVKELGENMHRVKIVYQYYYWYYNGSIL